MVLLCHLELCIGFSRDALRTQNSPTQHFDVPDKSFAKLILIDISCRNQWSELDVQFLPTSVFLFCPCTFSLPSPPPFSWQSPFSQRVRQAGRQADRQKGDGFMLLYIYIYLFSVCLP